MRKPESQCTDIAEIEEILKGAEVGSIGLLTPDGFPRVIPVNYATRGTTVYFHGAMRGEKYDLLIKSPKVTFSVWEHYSVLPSYWLAEENALGATQFFKSVQINGRAVVVEDREEKASALQWLMEKYQPEGNFKPVTTSEKLYEVVISKTLLVRIDPEQVTARVKFGQGYTRATRRDLIAYLEERGTELDMATAKEIRRTLGRSQS